MSGPAAHPSERGPSPSAEPGAGGEPGPFLLYGGERLVESVAVGHARVGVTTHRVLAHTPRGGGPRLRSIDRPNATGAAIVSGGDLRQAARGLRVGLTAAVLLGAGLLLDLDGLIEPVSVPSETGLGGIVGTVSTIMQLIALLDDLLLVAGLVLVPVGLFYGVVYLRGRERYLEVTVAGDDPLRVPIGDATGAETAATRLAAALETASNAPGR